MQLSLMEFCRRNEKLGALARDHYILILEALLKGETVPGNIIETYPSISACSGVRGKLEGLYKAALKAGPKKDRSVFKTK